MQATDLAPIYQRVTGAGGNPRPNR
jgi:hypothetical protein